MKKHFKNNYWDGNMDHYIEQYQQLPEGEEKDKLFQIIYPAFIHLAEAVFFTFGGNKTSQEYTHDIILDLAHFAFEKIHLYKRSETSKSFSYFNTVTRNRLFLFNKDTKKRNDLMSSLEGLTEDESGDPFEIVEIPEKISNDISPEYLEFCRQWWNKHFDILFKKENHVKRTARIILELMFSDEWNCPETRNAPKKSLFALIRKKFYDLYGDEDRHYSLTVAIQKIMNQNKLLWKAWLNNADNPINQDGDEIISPETTASKRSRNYYLKNRKKLIEQSKQWRKKNRQRVKSYAKEYRETHKEQYREYARQYDKEYRAAKINKVKKLEEITT